MMLKHGIHSSKLKPQFAVKVNLSSIRLLFHIAMEILLLFTHFFNEILCHSLPDAAAIGNNYFRVTPNPAWLTGVECSGSEKFLLDCAHSTMVDCSSASDAAGVVCLGTIGECERAGFTSCCEENCTTGSCLCDDSCLLNDTLPCCSDTSRLCSSTGKHSMLQQSMLERVCFYSAYMCSNGVCIISFSNAKLCCWKFSQ